MIHCNFLDKNEAKKELIKCEYLKKIGSQEINLRVTRYLSCAITRIELMENYTESVIPFSGEEKNYIKKQVEKACILLCDILPNLNTEEYKFIKVHGTLDWYHSFAISKNCIVLPFKMFYNTKEEDFLKTIIKCIIYCNQHQEKKSYDNYYNNMFGFEKVNENNIIVLKDEQRVLTNPNGLKKEWVINLCDGFYLPCMILNCETPISCLLPLRKFSDYYVSKNDPIIASTRKDFINMINNVSHNEKLDHPNEIFASNIIKNFFS